MEQDGYVYAVLGRLTGWANVRPTEYRAYGKITILDRGQIITSIDELKKSLKFNKKTIVNVLTFLETSGVISQKTSRRGRIITINVYNKYQNNNGSKEDDANWPEGSSEPTEVDSDCQFDTSKGSTEGVVIEELKTLRIINEEEYNNPTIHNKLMFSEQDPISKQKSKKKDPIPKKRGGTKPEPTAQATPSSLFEIWNANCGDLPKACGMSRKRLAAEKQRLEDNQDLEYWTKVVQELAASTFCQGKNELGWKAGIDFLLKPDTHFKVLEGMYKNKGLQSHETPLKISAWKPEDAW